MISDTNKKIAQLQEINRALLHDLDISRRFTSELGRERDALIYKIEELNSQLTRLRSDDTMLNLEKKVDAMRCEMKKDKEKTKELHRKLETRLKLVALEDVVVDGREEKHRDEFEQSQNSNESHFHQQELTFDTEDRRKWNNAFKSQ